MAVIQDNRTQALALLDRGLDPNLRYAELYRPTIWGTIRWDWLRLTQHKRDAFDFGPKTPTLLIIAITNGDTELARGLPCAPRGERERTGLQVPKGERAYRPDPGLDTIMKKPPR